MNHIDKIIINLKMYRIIAAIALVGLTQAVNVQRDLPALNAANNLAGFDANNVASSIEQEDFRKEVMNA